MIDKAKSLFSKTFMVGRQKSCLAQPPGGEPPVALRAPSVSPYEYFRSTYVREIPWVNDVLA